MGLSRYIWGFLEALGKNGSNVWGRSSAAHGRLGRCLVGPRSLALPTSVAFHDNIGGRSPIKSSILLQLVFPSSV